MNKYRTIQGQIENCPIFTAKNPSLPQISVILVSYNAPRFLQVCLESVQLALRELEGEIIVVDNASKENNISMIQSCFPEVKLIINDGNRGFSKAVNQGVKQAEGDFILIMNPDVVLPEEGLKEAVTFMKRDSQVGALGCRFIDGQGDLLPECKRNLPGVRAAFFKVFGLNWGYYAKSIDEYDTEEVEVLTGAFMLMRKKLFEQVGGFDEQFFMFGEDIDLSFRIREAGYRNFYFGAFSLIHFKGESSVKNSEYLRHFYGALNIFYEKHFKGGFLSGKLLKAFVNTAVFTRSFRTSKIVPSQDFDSVLYLGNRSAVFKGIKKKFPTASMDKRILDDCQDIDKGIVFFDSASLSYKEIIDLFQKSPKCFSKRIVSQTGDFYMGSDWSFQSGEAIGIDINKK